MAMRGMDKKFSRKQKRSIERKIEEAKRARKELERKNEDSYRKDISDTDSNCTEGVEGNDAHNDYQHCLKQMAHTSHNDDAD
jgi:hypothetical protein